MKHRITVADVRAALDGFVRSGLVRIASPVAPAEDNSLNDPTPPISKRPVQFSSGEAVTLSPGGQNPLIKAIIEQFCPTFAPGGVVIYIGDTENKFVHLETAALAALGVTLDSAAKIPDVIVHYTAKNWLLLIEAVTSAGPVDGKRRKELKDLFAGCKAGLVFVTAFEDRRTMQSFISQIAWESEVWIAEDPAHMIHFNGERFLGPYPDVTPPLA